MNKRPNKPHQPPNPAGQRGAVWFLILFSPPFAGVGVFMGWLTLSTLGEWRKASQWVETPAYILESHLETNEDSDGSTTYQATARYRYSFDDRNYEGERVSLFGGADNIGDFHQRAYSELSRYVGGEQPFRCYVNPQDPSQALLYREMRWGMLAFYLLFAVTFGGAGIGLLLGGLFADRDETEEPRAAVIRGVATGAQAPWLQRPDWRSGRIESGGKAAMIGMSLFALVWLLITSPALFVLPEELKNGNYVALLVLVFPLVGLALLLMAAYKVLHWLKFGNVLLILESTPGRIGGELRGHLEIPAPVESRLGINLRLRCVRQITTGSGKGARTREEVLWEHSQIALPSKPWEKQRTEAPVRFRIPADTQETDYSNPRDKVLWRLEASAEAPGVDLGAQFEVPVFRTDSAR